MKNTYYPLIMVSGALFEGDQIHFIHEKRLQNVVSKLKHGLGEKVVIISTPRYNLPKTGAFLKKKLSSFQPVSRAVVTKSTDIITELFGGTKKSTIAQPISNGVYQEEFKPSWIDEKAVNKEVNFKELHEIVTSKFSKGYDQVILVSTFVETRDYSFFFLKEQTGAGMRFPEIDNGEALFISVSPKEVIPITVNY